MNKIIVEVSIGELLDKISILEIKLEKIKDPEKLKFISDEHSVLKEQLEKNVKSDNINSRLRLRSISFSRVHANKLNRNK